MAFDPSQFQKRGQKVPKGRTQGVLISAIIFMIFGVLLIMKLLSLDYSFLKYIPDVLLYWIAALGSIIGGLYMIYRKYIYRQRLVVR